MASFTVNLSFQGKTVSLSDVTTDTSGADLHQIALVAFDLDDGASLKLLYKGKRLDQEDITTPVFQLVPKKAPKILVMATSSSVISDLQSKRSDPLMRGFDQERSRTTTKEQQQLAWGPTTAQDKNYKFCRFQACTWQSFGHRPSTDGETPHAFEAMQLLNKLATDPGIVAIMKERELVVGTLGEMDPIDDRLMQTKQQEGACLLGYNTNGGTRIDLKLRCDDLKGFRPYSQLMATLIHELSHNWVGEHNLLFWTNFGQMRAEYVHTHLRLRSTVVAGKTTAELAGLKLLDTKNVYDFVMQELQQDMAQHGLHPNMIAAPIEERCRQLDETRDGGQRLGGASSMVLGEDASGGPMTTSIAGASVRDLALAAAEQRAKAQRKSGDSS
mmetsp:Transcript_29574/g.48798  ORF Transcript_29574/g.48798 Transcript_29574/m.48798 type:complete len:386 (+) Transcript_29574:107-1264(+)